MVNNNAAAVFLVLNTLAEGREAVVSRGELVEIGGEFRIPEVMEKSGVRLREVGATNRTRLGDYERAITERTGLILKVHTSNFRILGFTEEVAVSDLVALGGRTGIPVMHDLGSGCLIDLGAFRPGAGADGPGGRRSGADVVYVQRRQAPRRAAGRNHHRPSGEPGKDPQEPPEPGPANRQDDPGGPRSDPDRLS